MINISRFIMRFSHFQNTFINVLMTHLNLLAKQSRFRLAYMRWDFVKGTTNFEQSATIHAKSQCNYFIFQHLHFRLGDLKKSNYVIVWVCMQKRASFFWLVITKTESEFDRNW